MTTVYLAGKMTGLTMCEMSAWREKAKALLREDVRVLDPVETELSKGITSRAIVDSNKFQISHSDVVLAELNHDDVSIGTIGEIIFARQNEKPVIAWGGARRIVNHPWITDHITIHLTDLETAVEYINQNYCKNQRKE